MKRPSNIDAYIASAPEPARASLERMRATIQRAAPAADEAISYGLPTFKYKGRALIHFGAAKSHLALYGAIPAAIDPKDLAAFDASKGTVRFPFDKPPPATLLKKFVKARMAEIDAIATAKKET